MLRTHQHGWKSFCIQIRFVVHGWIDNRFLGVGRESQGNINDDDNDDDDGGGGGGGRVICNVI